MFTLGIICDENVARLSTNNWTYDAILRLARPSTPLPPGEKDLITQMRPEAFRGGSRIVLRFNGRLKRRRLFFGCVIIFRARHEDVVLAGDRSRGRNPMASLFGFGDSNFWRSICIRGFTFLICTTTTRTTRVGPRLVPFRKEHPSCPFLLPGRPTWSDKTWQTYQDFLSHQGRSSFLRRRHQNRIYTIGKRLPFHIGRITLVFLFRVSRRFMRTRSRYSSGKARRVRYDAVSASL